MKIEIQPDERTIDTWPITYISPDGESYNGKLTITDKRLLYNISAKALISEGMSLRWGNKERLEIKKSDIKEVQVEKSIMVKKIIVTLDEGSLHIFNYGALNIDRIEEAIRAK